MAREVKVAVVGDARQLQKELQKAEKAVAGFGKNAKDSSETLKNVFIGSAVAFGAKEIIQSASELQAAVGGTAAVFGTASAQVDKFAQSAAETSGLSEKAARDLTSKLGASLKGAGLSAEDAAKQAMMLTQTGADLAATLGGTTEEAVSALGGALRGEFDPLERFGIALKASDINARAVAMGLAKSESDVSAYAKGQAALALITERSAFAQGTFAKESGTAEGAAKIAGARLQNTSADIGKSFLPIYTKAAEVVGVLAKAFDALPGPVQVGVLALGAAIAVGPKIYEGFTAATNAVKSIPASFDKLTSKLTSSKGMFDGFGTTAEKAGAQSAQAAGTGGIGALTPALLGVGTALAIGAIFWKAYNDKQEKARALAEQFLGTLDESTGAFTNETNALIRNSLEKNNQIDNLNNAGISLKRYTDAINDTAGGTERLSRLEHDYIRAVGVRSTDRSRKQTIEDLRNEHTARTDLVADLIQTGQLDIGLLRNIIDQSNATDKSIQMIRQRAEAQALQNGATQEEARLAGLAAQKNAENAAAIKDTYDATLALLNSNIAYQQAQVQSQKAIDEYNKSLRDGSLSAADRKEKELALLSQFLSTAGAAAKAAEDQAKLEGKTISAGDAAKIQRDKLIELAGTLDPNSPVQYGLQLMISQLQGVIDRQNINIAVTTSGLTEAQIEIRNLLGIDGLAGVKGKGLGFRIIPEGERALGGPVRAGKPYLVGERGPELFVPAGYGNIMDNVSTMSTLTNGTGIGGGGTINVTVNMPPGSNGDDVVNAIRRYERRNGPIFASA